VVLERVGGPESDVYICIPEKIGNFVYKRTVEGERDPISALCGRH
jgi:hypothetical protein